MCLVFGGNTNQGERKNVSITNAAACLPSSAYKCSTFSPRPPYYGIMIQCTSLSGYWFDILFKPPIQYHAQLSLVMTTCLDKVDISGPTPQRDSTQKTVDAVLSNCRAQTEAAECFDCSRLVGRDLITVMRFHRGSWATATGLRRDDHSLNITLRWKWHYTFLVSVKSGIKIKLRIFCWKRLQIKSQM